MLPKKNRIRKNADFGVICRYGKTLSCGKISLKLKKNDLGLIRLGISVGVKFSPRAVDRNRIKRQIREFFRLNLERMETGWDIVVIVQKGANEAGNFLVELEKGLARSGVINNLSPTAKNS